MGNPAVEAVKALDASKTGPGEVVLSTGVRVRLRPVPAWLVQEAQARVEDPPVPNWHNPDKDRDEPNPNDPDYLLGITRANVKRAEAVTDVAMLCGVELVDAIPPDNVWLPKLRFLEKRGALSLGNYDLTDELEKTFVYIKYVAMGSDDFTYLAKLAGLSGEDVDRAVRSFRSQPERRSDNGSAAQE